MGVGSHHGEAISGRVRPRGDLRHHLGIVFTFSRRLPSSCSAWRTRRPRADTSRSLLVHPRARHRLRVDRSRQSVSEPRPDRRRHPLQAGLQRDRGLLPPDRSGPHGVRRARRDRRHLPRADDEVLGSAAENVTARGAWVERSVRRPGRRGSGPSHRRRARRAPRSGSCDPRHRDRRALEGPGPSVPEPGAHPARPSRSRQSG